jgi:hypothetical protein
MVLKPLWMKMEMCRPRGNVDERGFWRRVGKDECGAGGMWEKDAAWSEG